MYSEGKCHRTTPYIGTNKSSERESPSSHVKKHNKTWQSTIKWQVCFINKLNQLRNTHTLHNLTKQSRVNMYVLSPASNTLFSVFTCYLAGDITSLKGCHCRIRVSISEHLYIRMHKGAVELSLIKRMFHFPVCDDECQSINNNELEKPG